MLHKVIVSGESAISGQGLIVTQEIKAGETTWWSDPDHSRFHTDTISTWPSEKQVAFYQHAWQIGDGWFHGSEDGDGSDPDLLMNHSCDPNTWFIDDTFMVARRAIVKGEEVTYDYATSESDANDDLIESVCNCGSQVCRGTIRPTDYATSSFLQETYGEHVMSHVLRKLN